MKKDFYAALEVEPGASLQDIKRAYRRLVRQYHPDSTESVEADVEERFHEIQEAYDTLSDHERRKDYDALYVLLYGEPPKKETQRQAASSSYARTAEQTEPSHDSDNEKNGESTERKESDAERMQRLNREQHRSMSEPPPYASSVPPKGRGEGERPSGRFFDRIFDAVRPKKGTAAESSDRLKSSPQPEASEGKSSSSGAKSTQQSTGTGKSSRPSSDRERIYNFTLNQLEALGESSREIALESYPDPKLIRVRIPAGITDGTILKVNIPGLEGSIQRNQATTVRIKVTVLPHPFVTRQGNSITIRVPITVTEALTAASLEVPTLEGPIAIRVPEKWKPESTVVLKNRGLQEPGKTVRGDLIITFYVVLPTKVSDAALLAAQAIDQHNLGLVRESLPKKLG